MKINKNVKKALVGLAVLGSVFAAGCGGPKAPKDMTFDELMTDWTQNIEKVATERDKMVEDYVKKDPETYKILAKKQTFNVIHFDKELDAMNLSSDDIAKTQAALEEIKEKTQPQVDRMKEEQEKAKEILMKRQYDKDQMAVENDRIRYSNATKDFSRRIIRKDNDTWSANETQYGRARYNMSVFALGWDRKRKDK